MKKTFYCIVALILSLSMCLVGCKNKSKESEGEETGYTKYVGKGIHTATVLEKDSSIILNLVAFSVTTYH